MSRSEMSTTVSERPVAKVPSVLLLSGLNALRNIAHSQSSVAEVVR